MKPETEDRCRAEAVDYARSYRGTFPFLAEMASLAQNRGWTPTDDQVTAILRSRAFERSGDEQPLAFHIRRRSPKPGESPLGTVANLLLSFLTEEGLWDGTPYELGEALTARATPEQLPALPEPGDWAEAIDRMRFHLIRFGWSFWPAKASEFQRFRIYRKSNIRGRRKYGSPASRSRARR